MLLVRRGGGGDGECENGAVFGSVEVVKNAAAFAALILCTFEP